MDEDALLGEMLDFDSVAPPRAAAATQAATLPPAAQPDRVTPLPAAAPRSVHPASPASMPQVGAAVAPAGPALRAPPSPIPANMGGTPIQGWWQAIAQLYGMLRRFDPAPDKQGEAQQYIEAFGAALTACKTQPDYLQAYEALKSGLKKVYGIPLYEKAKLYAHNMGRNTPPPQAASPARAPTPAAQQRQQQQLKRQQGAVLQHPQQPSAARATTPNPAPSSAPAVVTGQPAGMQAQQGAMVAPGLQQQLQAQALAQQQAAAAAALAGAGAAPRRPADGDQPAAKRPKTTGGGATAAGAKKKEEDAGLTVDALIDYDQETNQLMEGLQRSRMEGRTRAHNAATQQFLSEWRVGYEFFRYIQKTGGGMGVKGECFEVMQLAFQSHMSGLLTRALRNAQHRQDAARRSTDTVVTSDPRRGVTQIERREKVKAEARAEAERVELLRMAGSKRADEETKERAQKAKAELVGKQQANLANLAVAATLGGKSTSKWAKWATAGTAGAAGDGAAEAGAAGGKKKGGSGKKGGKKGAAAAEGSAAEASDAGPAASAGGSDASGAAAPGAGADASAAKVQGRTRLTAGTGSDDASMVHLRDVICVLERDPAYRASGLLYRLYNTPRAAASTVTAQV